MIAIRCRDCNKELIGYSSKPVSCGCPNMATISGDKITALDLSRIVMLSSHSQKQKSSVLTNEDIMWQEARRQRKVRKLDFEIK